MNRNRGSTTVEACIVVPLFLFFMLAITYMGMMLMADAHIHQSLAEAAIYGAQYCYLEERMLGEGSSIVNMAIINSRFRTYLGDDKTVDKIVAGGRNGIIVTAISDTDNRKIFHAKASYVVRIPVPIIGSFQTVRTDEVRQKAFLGYDKSETDTDNDTYVYITPNESVYHMSRGCSHLNRKVTTRESHGNYPPCSFCGKKDNGSGKVYIAENGDVYHYDSHCLGLKRTVMRVKKSSVSGLGPCSICGR